MVQAHEPASVETFGQLLGILIDTNIPAEDVETTAWRPIVEQWAQGWTSPLVDALLNSNVDLQTFLAQLLRRIWVTMLGEDPKVLGIYKAIYWRVDAPSANDIHDADITRLLECAHPGLKDRHTFNNPWGNHFHPPAVTTWAPTSSHVPIVSHSSSTLSHLLEAAKDAREDLNAVFIRGIPHYPDGLTDIGQSAEVRAFWSCYLISLYSPMPNTTRFQISLRNSRIMDELTSLSDLGVASMYMLLLPVVKSLTAQHHDPALTMSKVWHSTPALPLWYFLLNLADRIPQVSSAEVSDEIKSVLCDLHAHKDSFPVITGAADWSVRVSLATVIAWIAEWTMLVTPKAIRMPASEGLPRRRYTRKVFWIDSTTVSDVNACISSLDQLGLGEAWRSISADFRTATLDALVKENNFSKYSGHLRSVSREMLDAYTCVTLPCNCSPR
ncbi:hypothetical protein BC835DRAFT_857127 [Cytidiella melzeri]|nr:hypothetical protein BC835DRAFT_857127 [Cytidiella melzeri]